MSFKLLEINIFSAQDLAPVSKLLRTFAVAWVHPDQKLTTRVDHHGNTNPTWNYRFVFGLDDPFLSSSSSLTVEIYNVSWLRDIPIGSVHAPIASILPPPSRTKSNKRFVSLQIRRPSGTLQGTLNLGVNVVDSPRRSVILDRQLSAPSTGRDAEPTANRSPHKASKRNHDNQAEEEEEEKKKAKIRKLSRSQSDCTDEESLSLSKSTSIFKFSKIPKVTAAPSICSYKMRPLPSEVAASMAKGLYSTSSSGDIGSSVFENWTVVGGELAARRKSVRWKTDDEFTPWSKKKNRSAGSGGGLLSCFGILCGYECNIFCGAPKSKRRIKKWRVGESN